MRSISLDLIQARVPDVRVAYIWTMLKCGRNSKRTSYANHAHVGLTDLQHLHPTEPYQAHFVLLPIISSCYTYFADTSQSGPQIIPFCPVGLRLFGSHLIFHRAGMGCNLCQDTVNDHQYDTEGDAAHVRTTRSTHVETPICMQTGGTPGSVTADFCGMWAVDTLKTGTTIQGVSKTGVNPSGFPSPDAKDKHG
jgi:hypothetical protein